MENLTEEKYGPYLNQSLKFYSDHVKAFANLSDLVKGEYITESCRNQTETFTFNTVQLVRVIITWTLFFISAVGNIFVLLCVCRRSRTSHVHLIMLHFAIADLAFTFLVLPEDALWNTTMQWYGGDLLCRACQMGKQIGMYISSFMVVVMALDRCCGILQPMCTLAKQRRRTKYLVGGAWVLSVLSAIPPAILFRIVKLPFCPDVEPFLQCMDNSNEDAQMKLRPYYFFTMAMSFLLPMILCAVFYSLVICEITNMMKRDRVMMGRRDSNVHITRARKKTLKMTALVTLSFLFFWGPYYAYGVYFWFTGGKFARQISALFFLLMYVHPAVHPFIYGILMKDVRKTFRTMMLHLGKIITCSASELTCGDGSCLQSPGMTHYSHGNGYVRSVNDGQPSNSSHNQKAQSITMTKRKDDSERDELLRANSNNASEDALPPLQTQTSHNSSAGSTTRTSQVSFNLPPPDKTRENGGTGLNNNKEVVDSKNGDIFKSTDV